MSRPNALARVERMPTPAHWSDDDPMTLAEAVAVFWPYGPLTIASLRTEIGNGRLTPAHVAGKHFVTPAQIRALFQPEAPACPAGQKAPASISVLDVSTRAPENRSRTSGTSATDRASLARAAALRACEKLSKRLAEYIAEKWTPAIWTGSPTMPSDPAKSSSRTSLPLYVRERAPQLADPVSTAGRVKALLAGGAIGPGRRQALDLPSLRCPPHHPTDRAGEAETARKRHVTEQGARRELEDLSAAIGHWHGEYPLSARPKVWLPHKPESPRDALTRSQAAALLRAARAGAAAPTGVGAGCRLRRAPIANTSVVSSLLGSTLERRRA